MAGSSRGPSTDALDLYLDDLGRWPLLDREEEAALARRHRDGGDRRALHGLVTANLRFVVATAKRYRGRGVPLADLINEGNLGLLRAAERFDPDRGVRFISYAAWFVRQAMLEAVGRAEPPPAAGRSRGRDRRDGDRARRRAVLLSLDAPPAPGGDGAPLGERLGGPAGAGPESRTLRRDRRRTLETGLAFLPRREERVLRLFFGLDGRGSRTLEAIGRELGVSRERVRQLKARALARMRDGPHGGRLRSLRD